MSEPTYNVDLLMQVREKVVNEPERHYQALWGRADRDPRKGGDCGTAYCVAGWATVLDGQELEWDHSEAGHWEAWYTLSGASIGVHAKNALRLSSWEVGCLFSGDNRREYVLRVLDALIEAGKNGERVSDDDPVWDRG